MNDKPSLGDEAPPVISDRVCTRWLGIYDDADRLRIVGQVHENGVAELRVKLADPGNAEALIFASKDRELGSLVGIQLWADGNALVELAIWPDDKGVWRVTGQLGDSERA